MNNLSYCSNCHENSVITRIYTRKDNVTTRVMYCINRGCGYVKRLPLPNEITKRKEKNYAR